MRTCASGRADRHLVKEPQSGAWLSVVVCRCRHTFAIWIDSLLTSRQTRTYPPPLHITITARLSRSPNVVSGSSQRYRPNISKGIVQSQHSCMLSNRSFFCVHRWTITANLSEETSCFHSATCSTKLLLHCAELASLSLRFPHLLLRTSVYQLNHAKPSIHWSCGDAARTGLEKWRSASLHVETAPMLGKST